MSVWCSSGVIVGGCVVSSNISVKSVEKRTFARIA